MRSESLRSPPRSRRVGGAASPDPSLPPGNRGSRPARGRVPGANGVRGATKALEEDKRRMKPSIVLAARRGMARSVAPQGLCGHTNLVFSLCVSGLCLSP